MKTAAQDWAPRWIQPRQLPFNPDSLKSSPTCEAKLGRLDCGLLGATDTRTIGRQGEPQGGQVNEEWKRIACNAARGVSTVERDRGTIHEGAREGELSSHET